MPSWISGLTRPDGYLRTRGSRRGGVKPDPTCARVGFGFGFELTDRIIKSRIKFLFIILWGLCGISFVPTLLGAEHWYVIFTTSAGQAGSAILPRVLVSWQSETRQSFLITSAGNVRQPKPVKIYSVLGLALRLREATQSQNFCSENCRSRSVSDAWKC